MDELLNAAPCGFVSFADDGRILECNDGFVALVGRPRTALIGARLETLFSSGGKVFYHTHLLPLLKLQGKAEEIYVSLRMESGEEQPVLINGVRNERGGQTLNDCVLVRMRLRRRYEDELLRAKREAEAASVAKAKLISMMSHDLRTPLHAISGYAAVLLEGMHGPLSSDQQDDLSSIRNAAGELKRLLDDVLSFSQLEAGRIQIRAGRVLVREALERAESLIRLRMAHANLEYTRAEPDREIMLEADPDRLQQILLNVLTNAIKFTPTGGRIAADVTWDETTGRIHVRDSGPGIPADAHESIFEPFTQLESTPTAGGVGLGLSISRELARAMRGDLSVESTPGAGSTFTLSLPLARG